MKYKIGDKVKYDGGDWWFYGTVSAVFEHSICPCYRLNVERMEKKVCKFSITQFEFELEPHQEVIDGEKMKRKWDNAEVELLKKYYGTLGIEDLSKMLKRSSQSIEDKWQQLQPESEILLPVVQEEAVVKAPVPPSADTPEPVKKRRRRRKNEMTQENAETVQKPKKERRKRGEAWDDNFEKYRNGEKSNAISSWMAINRKEYKSGKLAEKKLDRLLEINFPFETKKKKTIVGTND